MSHFKPNYFQRRSRPQGPKANERIRAIDVQVIGSDGNNLRNMNTLQGGDITWLIGNEIKKHQLLQYSYPSEKEIEDANIKITFLGYYWKDWSLVDNGNFSTLRGLDIRNEKPWEIGDPLGITSLDEDWVTLNQMIKYLKYGFGRISDYVNEDVRLGRITRKEGILMNEKYDGKCSEKYIKSFSDYIGITVNEFWIQVDKSVNTDLFIKHGLGNYEPKFKVGKGL